LYPDKCKEGKRKWELNNPEKHYRGIQRRRWRKLGLDPDVIEPLFNAHNNICDSCGLPSEKTLVTDHCHTTGKFRGFLCSNCNTGLGMFKDDPIRLQKAIDYITNYTLTYIKFALTRSMR
jgi:hypothetical protein